MNNTYAPFILGIPNHDPGDDYFHFLKTYRPKGVILLSKNYESKTGLIELIKKIKNVDKGILITVDHEGGRVQRFKNGFSILPSFRDFCFGKTSDEIYNEYAKVALELKELGVDFNYVPVADMTNETGGVIGDRSIGLDVDLVKTCVKSTVLAYKNQNIMTSVKHFPGYGSVNIDTHKDFATSTRTKDELFSYELIPFISAIKAGVSSVMLSHIVFKNIDREPVSVSRVFNNIIRNDLNFKGLIISDDMSMGAISDYYGTKEASKKSLENGTDLIILSGYKNCDINEFAQIIDYCT